MKFAKTLLALSLTAALAGCNPAENTSAEAAAEKPAATASAAQPATAESVINNYMDIAQAVFEDSLTTAKNLQQKVDALLAEPTEANLQAAKDAWLAARAPYQQSEAFRFGNAIVDDWEGRVNAWPLDEGLIDYVASSYGEDSDVNALYTANVIANPMLDVNGQTIDASSITKELLADTLHEADEVETNVATGYHAIEFMLWGQDLNGNKPGAGERPASDFSLEDCSNGHCERRRDYLKAATDLLVDDLQEMADNWAADGIAREQLLAKGEQGAVASILTGMGSLSYGELAGERTKLGLMLHDPEEEHDCFSDNTHNSHFYDAKGIQNVYLGSYTRVDGSVVSGTSLSDLVKAADADVDAELRSKLDNTMAAMQVMVDEAAKGNTYDVLIAAGNTQGNQQVMDAVNGLVAQAGSIEDAIAALGLTDIELEGSDSLDNPERVGAE